MADPSPDAEFILTLAVLALGVIGGAGALAGDPITAAAGAFGIAFIGVAATVPGGA